MPPWWLRNGRSAWTNGRPAIPFGLPKLMKNRLQSLPVGDTTS
ncbi:MAG: hypothetical protein QM579_04350 [Desulfovibrio sp.]